VEITLTKIDKGPLGDLRKLLQPLALRERLKTLGEEKIGVDDVLWKNNWRDSLIQKYEKRESRLEEEKKTSLATVYFDLGIET
jgi:hypothetical protein